MHTLTLVNRELKIEYLRQHIQNKVWKTQCTRGIQKPRIQSYLHKNEIRKQLFSMSFFSGN